MRIEHDGVSFRLAPNTADEEAALWAALQSGKSIKLATEGFHRANRSPLLDQSPSKAG